MAELINGSVEILELWDGAAYEPIACLNSNGINEQREVIESTTKCDPDEVKRSNAAYSYEMSFEGEFAKTEAGKQSWVELKERIRSTTDSVVTWRVTTTYIDDSTTVEYGSGILTSLEKTAETNANITFSGTISGNGKPTNTDPNA